MPRRRFLKRWSTSVLAILVASGGVGASTEYSLGDEVLPLPVAVATTELPPIPALTIRDLESMALRSNPTLSQATAAIEQVRGNMIQAGLYPNPQAGYLRNDADRPGTLFTTGVFFGQEMVTARKRQKSQAVEAREIDRLMHEYQAQRLRVLNDLRIRFYDVLGAERQIQATDQLVGIAEKSLATTQQLVAARHATRADVLQSQVQLKQVRLLAREARVRYDSAWRQLANVIGMPDLRPAPLADDIMDDDVALVDFEAEYQRLLAESPQLRAAVARIGHARAELVSERARVYPNVTLQVVAEQDNINQYSSVNTFLSLPVPVFNRNQGNIHHANADLREAHAEVRRTQLALRDALAEACQRFETARMQVNDLRNEILPDAEAALTATAEAQRSGEVSALQVIAAERTYFESRMSYVQAWTELRKVAAEIDGLLLTGGLNPAELGRALQGGGQRAQGLLNQQQDSQSPTVLPPAIQTSGGP